MIGSRCIPALAFLVVSSGAAVSENRIDTVRPDAPALAAFGPHSVGRTTLQLSHPGQIDIVNVPEEGPLPVYDRPLTVEVFYPAQTSAPATPMATVTRDGTTPTELIGRSVEGAAPKKDAGAPYPLVLISHGYPGNRFLMAHLAENLASKGYVTASIDHTDSTYSDKAAFGATLVHRPLDQAFVLDEMERLSSDDSSPLFGMVDTARTGLIGYSMGGYGALIFGGAGVTQEAVELSWGAPRGTLARHLAGSDELAGLQDPRLSAIIAIGPWGRARDFWDADGMAGLSVPTLFVAGSEDDISGYEDGIKRLYEEATGTDRHLLTFISAGHNAAAPMPAPRESYGFSDELGWYPFEHYADPVWDNVRMNNIVQHFATAFLDLHIKQDASQAEYLDLVPVAEDGVYAKGDDGAPKADHTYWAGFKENTARGLLFETRPKAD